MKKRIALFLAALLSVASFAADEVISVKSGDVVFKTMNTDMKTFYPNADIAFISVDDAKQRISLNTGDEGSATTTLKDGRYLLEVGGSNVAIVEASAKGQLEEVRLLATDASMLIGGQDEAEGDKVVIPGAGEEAVEVEDGSLVQQDDGQYVETSEGALIQAVEDSYTEIDEGNFIRTVDGRWWRLDSEAAAAAGKKKGLVLVAAGVVAAIIIAAIVEDDDDDDDPITGAVGGATDAVAATLDSAEAAVTSAGSTGTAAVSTPSAGGSSAAAPAAAVEVSIPRTGSTGSGGSGSGSGGGSGNNGGGTPVSP